MPSKYEISWTFLALFVLAAAQIAAVQIFSYQSVRSSLWGAREVTHTQEAMTSLHDLESAFQELDTSHRGYALTGRREFVDSYWDASVRIRPLLSQARLLAGDVPGQLDRLDQLEPLLTGKIGQMDRSIGTLQRAGPGARLRVDLAADAIAGTGKIRAMIEDLEQEERRLLFARQERAAAAAKFVAEIIALGSFFGLGLLGLSAWIILHQIGRRRKAEAERDKFFGLSLELLSIAGLDGYFKDINPAWQREFGYTTEELRAVPFIEFVHPDDRERTSAEVRKLAAGIDTVNFENRYRRKDGSYRWLLWNASPNPAEKVIYAVAHDITEFKNAERMKNEFIAMATHELKTPLTSIRAALDTISAEKSLKLGEPMRSLMDIAGRNSRQMGHLVDDFMSVEKLEYGQVEFVLEPVEMAALAMEALDAHRSYADKYGVRLTPDRRSTAVAWVRADRSRLLQVLANLLSNAIKFSPRGSDVEVAVARRGNSVRVQVTDHGPGIPEEFRGRIFQKFARAERDRRRHDSTGLGLTIAKTIVEKLGGRIGFETRQGEGTTFYFDLPSAPVEGGAAEPPVKSRPRSIRTTMTMKKRNV